MPEPPFSIIAPEGASRWLVTCDHATNRVPDWVCGGSLGISAADMNRHIAFDVGAAPLARAVAARLGATAILSDFSRLVIDPNRGEDDPTLVMRLYDGTIIPANRTIGRAEIEERLARLYRPYHAAYEQLASARPDRVICAVHSFTPQLHGRPARPWQVGILHSHLDQRLALPMIAACRARGWVTGDNQPYGGHLEGDSIDRHALHSGRPNILIEVRNDLIRDEAGQQLWAERLVSAMSEALERAGI